MLGKTDILAEASKIVLAPLVHNVANYITICDNSLQGVAEVQHLEADEDTIVEVSEDTIMEVNEDTIVEVDGVVHGVVQQVDGLFDESSMHSMKVSVHLFVYVLLRFSIRFKVSVVYFLFIMCRKNMWIQNENLKYFFFFYC